MTTAADIVTRAYAKIGIKAEDEALTAYQLSTGLDSLKMMLAAWRIHGVDVIRGALDADTPFPMQPEFEEGVVYNLAARIAVDYNLPVAFDADSFFRAIQAAYMQANPATLPGAILRTSSQVWPGR